MHTILRLRNPLLLAALAAAYPLSGHAAAAARIEFAAGNVVAVTPAGGQRLLVKGSTLDAGETIRTSEGGHAQLKFSDGAILSLQPQTELRIDEYTFDGKGGNPSDKGFFSLLKGGMRTITGLIGKADRRSYKVNTAVATIGIRGTEYSVLFTGGDSGTLNLATGEGAVEVCNAGGCVIVAGGESAIVAGNNTQPKRTDIKPNLPPASSSAPAAATYSNTENRDSNGGLAVLGGSLQTGPGYAVAIAGIANGSSALIDFTGGTTTTAKFNSMSGLTGFSTTTNGDFSGTPSTSVALQGVIGWGVWSSGTYSSGTPLTNFHYAVGKPTSTADLSGLASFQGTYVWAGNTTPTSTTGATGSSFTGSLTANFSTSTVNASVNFDIGGVGISFNANAMSISGATFSGGGTYGSGGSGSVKGFFAGANASHAGIVYQINATSDGLGTINGAAVFKQDSLTFAGGS